MEKRIAAAVQKETGRPQSAAANIVGAGGENRHPVGAGHLVGAVVLVHFTGRAVRARAHEQRVRGKERIGNYQFRICRCELADLKQVEARLRKFCKSRVAAAIEVTRIQR